MLKIAVAALLGHSFRNQDLLLPLFFFFIYINHTPMNDTKENSHIIQLDSPICEFNEGELCDQFKCCGEVLDSYTYTVIQQLTLTTQRDWPTDVLRVPIYNCSKYQGCHQRPLKFPWPSQLTRNIIINGRTGEDRQHFEKSRRVNFARY